MGKKHKKKDRHGQGETKTGGAAPLMGLAGLVMRQAGTPEGRQVIAAGLRAAADAIGGGRKAGVPTPPPPATPASPVPPVSPTVEAAPGEPGTRPTQAGMPPEVARIMGVAGAALERWATSIGQPRDGKDGHKPH